MSTRITVLRVLTSFVPPVHNQGVSLAPLQGPALWKLFLPTTGSFFVLNLTDLFCMIPDPAPCGGRFPDSFLISFSFPVTAEFNAQQPLLRVQFNRNRVLPVWGPVAMLSVPAAAGCPPAVSRHHNPRLWSVLYRIPL